MDRRLLTESLTGSWEHTRSARDALVEQGMARGTAVIEPVLDVLCDEQSPVDWTVSADVLCRIGEPALLPLADAVAAAGSPEVARRAGWALGRLNVVDQGVYAPLLNHPCARVRSNALFAFQRLGEAAVPFVDRLTPLLGDPEPEVRRRAVWAFTAIGTEAVPALRRLRREPATGPRIRSGALEALAAMGGPAVLDDGDLAAWRRLTRIKKRTEVPAGMHLCGSWYAVPSIDQAAVLDAFDLADPEPVTFRTGEAAWNHDHHNWERNRPHDTCARVYVSPVLDGWTLVFGDTSQDTHRIKEADDGDTALADVVRERCTDLSRTFGAAQWYGMSCGDGWTAWSIAEAGEVVRHYDAFDAEEDGDEVPSHPAEAGYLLPHQDGFPDDAFDGVNFSDSEAFRARHQQVKEELRIPDTCYANDIAARLSVDPGALGANTRVSGQGVLALTACGRKHGHPAGALPV
ncbi:HEAT repeat domain-containing protein [Streptomyces sp. NPDC059582]|uniref:HEAT repeat domain-containing protein n=1 Tax=Streptomyces sp. NPDC059582 TaxID=3346875 RepID=UPI0036ACE873